MQPLVFDRVNERGRIPTHGFLVPETGGLLAIDLRWPTKETPGIIAEDAYDWVITHLPTGFMLEQAPYTLASTQARAAGLAQAFYRECVTLGIELNTPDANAIIARVQALSKEERLRFWERIQASEDYLESLADAVTGDGV